VLSMATFAVYKKNVFCDLGLTFFRFRYKKEYRMSNERE